MASELQKLVLHWLRRWRAREALIWAVRGAAGGLAAGLVLAALARWRPILDTPALALWAGALALLGAILAGGTGFIWPRPALAASRYLDRRFSLAERTSTALEIALAAPRMPEWLARAQAEDALNAARAVDLTRSLPLEIRRREAAIGLGLAAALALLLLLPNPQAGLLAQQQAFQQAVSEQAAQVEQLRSRIQANNRLTETQKQSLTQPLDQALEQLQGERLTREQAVSILQAAQGNLQALADPQPQQLSRALQQAGEKLGPQTGEPLGEFADSLQQGELGSAAQALETLDPGALSADEQAALASQLELAASELEQAAPAISESLRQAAEAIRQGDPGQADQVLGQASEQLAEAAQQAEASGAAQEAASVLGQAKAEVAHAGTGSQGQPAQSGESGSASEGAQGQQGQSGAAEGQGQQAGVAGRGEGTGEGQGGEAGTDPIQAGGPGDGGLRQYEPVYSPLRIGGEGGPEVGLPGAGEPGELLGQIESDPARQGGVTVPYDEVYAAYRQAAYQAIDSGVVPIGLRALVRDYFTALEP